jgi:hypothetical protein
MTTTTTTTISLRHVKGAEPACNFVAKEAAIDALFALHAKRVAWLYIFFYVADLGFAFWIYANYLGELLMLMFSGLSLLAFALHIYAHSLLLTRVGGVARMVELRSSSGVPERNLPPVREFALLTQSWPIARWVLVTHATLAAVTGLLALLTLVYFVAHASLLPPRIGFVALYIVSTVVCLLLLNAANANFYRRAVVDSFRRVLPTPSAVERYARARWACAVNALYDTQSAESLADEAASKLLRSLRTVDGAAPRNATAFSNNLRAPAASSSSAQSAAAAAKRTKKRAKRK